MLHLQLELILPAEFIGVDSKYTVLRAIVDQRINFGWLHVNSLRDVIVRVSSVYVDERIRSRVPSNADLIFTTLSFVLYLGPTTRA